MTHIPFGYCYRCPYNLTYPSCDLHCVNVLEDEYFSKTVPPEEVAAVFVEPIQGEGGYVVPPPDFLGRLRELADRHGILLIFDEVQCGAGRTGKMWACEHFGAVPDILVSAKGLASGMPLGVTVARAEVMDWGAGAHASTFGGNPIACAAAMETIRLLEEKYIANAARIGDHILGVEFARFDDDVADLFRRNR